MCGRFVLAGDADEYARLFEVDRVSGHIVAPNYNVAPTDPIYAVAEHNDQRLLGPLRWGLIPHWATSPKGGLINARAETLGQKPAFRTSAEKRRCLIPADGFYEWSNKQPHFIYAPDRAPLAFAGIWSVWRDPQTSETVSTAAIVTTAAAGSVATLHDRMPVILSRHLWDIWLDRNMRDVDEVETIIRQSEAVLSSHQVSDLVNRVANNQAHLLDPIDLPPACN